MAQSIASVAKADVAFATRTSWTIQARRLLRSSRPYYTALGICIFFASWYLLVDVFKFWRFRELPGLVASVREWVSFDPVYGVSLFTAEYYSHIWASVYRVMSAFMIATVLGIAIGVLMGWSRIFRGLTFPILEMLRPIPVLAWIPLAILLLPGREAPIIGLTFLAAFFVTVLNTLLGVRSIDEVYFRAARSLGFSESAILFDIIIPGAMPYIFVGLQIAMGACWFSLVASEIVSGQAGLGYKVWETYYYVQYETMVIVMATLGLLGYVSSALVRIVGNRLMRWRAELLAGVLTMLGAARGGALSIRNAGKIYDPEGLHVVALEDVSFETRPGDFCVVVGPSGCGKTTLLNSIAGFDRLTSGEILLDGGMLARPQKQPRPGSDRMVVFQQGALFPWKTVLWNVSCGPIKQGKLKKAPAEQQARALLARVGLKGIEDQYPGSLSGGMKRRVEIVRALMNDPKVLLLDEPFRALDALTKSVVQEFLLELFDETPKTIFFITHDIEEAIFLADTVIVMTTRPGRVLKTIIVDIDRPRDYRVLTSERFVQIEREVREAIHDEARKAFEAGERELA